MKPSRPRESKDSIEKPTGSPSDESNKSPKERGSKYPISDNRSKKRAPPIPNKSTSMEEPTGSPSDASQMPPMNLMLFGRKGIHRTSIGKFILSQSHSKQNNSSGFVMRQAEVCGYSVTLFEVPSLATTPLSKEEVLKECHHSISQCAPGINAFLLALPGGPLTDEDKEELQRIQSIFGPRVNEFIMILYTNVSCAKGRPVHVSQQEATNLEQQFHKGCFVLSQEGGQKQIPEMLKKIKSKSDKCFTTDMFVEAEIKEEDKQKEFEKNKKIEEQVKSSAVIRNPDSIPDCVRIVLIGKTGVGKSATGNTILGKEAFKCAPWGTSVTKRCQKDTAQVNGRSVAVVDTPGLFDTCASKEDVIKEVLNCFWLLDPGPHVFLLILSIGTRMTPEENETLDLIKDTFGAGAEKFTMTLFTKGDNLESHSIEQYIEESHAIEQLVSDCEGRFHVFYNNDKGDCGQVTELMGKIDRMVKENGGGCYTSKIFKMSRERELKIEREKEEEKKISEEEHKRKLKEIEEKMKKIEDEARKKDEEFNKVREDLKKLQKKYKDKCVLL